MTLSVGLIAAIVVGVGLLAVLVKGLFIVQQSEAVVIERLGSYNRTLSPGINFIVPVLDQARPIKIRRYESTGVTSKELQSRLISETKIDTRETVLNFPEQPVFTKDNGSVRIDGALYFQIEDPAKAVYAVENLVQAVETLAKTTLRSVVGEMELDQLFSSRDDINNKLATVMDEAGNKWGVKVNRVELQDIVVPQDVEDAMHKQIAAERTRRAAITEANGNRDAEIRRAEGDKQGAILRAEGEREAIQQVLGAGQKEDGTTLIESDSVLSYLIAQRYIDMMPNMAKKGDRVLVPYEASALIGSVQSMQDLLPGGRAGAGGQSIPGADAITQAAQNLTKGAA